MISITSIMDRSSVYYGEIGAHIMAAAYVNEISLILPLFIVVPVSIQDVE
jgi:hypothetical protein